MPSQSSIVSDIFRHVYTSAASDLPTPSSKSRKNITDPLDKENLITMSKVSPNSCTDVILAQTPNLQKLGVRGKLVSLLEEKRVVLAAMPSGLGDIQMLRVVELSWTCRTAVASARMIQKNFKLLVFPPDQETQN
ncbi:hypothetical protein L2E82_10965 [Cichorium intybus]|uniref:Uncharacterized protein n=1 Tax=Cichorium intybus TaxID=13427 RepID=A0ACB9GBI2_CICIN|nr:hypothetical protein L2E82_10965 [Cichorium intybus]